MLVFLDRQHVGKPNKWNDSGATDEAGNLEVMLTARYIYWAEVRLRQLGVDVCILSDGGYYERHKRVNDYTRDRERQACYVACHVNAGGGDYSVCFYDYRSTSAGKDLAREISKAVKPIVGTSKSMECSHFDWTRNAFATIKSVRPPAICFEPFFIDRFEHSHLKTEAGLQKIGFALADGIHRWFRGLE